jgi:hypothetical protein
VYLLLIVISTYIHAYRPHQAWAQHGTSIHPLISLIPHPLISLPDLTHTPLPPHPFHR